MITEQKIFQSATSECALLSGHFLPLTLSRVSFSFFRVRYQKVNSCRARCTGQLEVFTFVKICLHFLPSRAGKTVNVHNCCITATISEISRDSPMRKHTVRFQNQMSEISLMKIIKYLNFRKAKIFRNGKFANGQKKCQQKFRDESASEIVSWIRSLSKKSERSRSVCDTNSRKVAVRLYHARSDRQPPTKSFNLQFVWLALSWETLTLVTKRSLSIRDRKTVRYAVSGVLMPSNVAAIKLLRWEPKVMQSIFVVKGKSCNEWRNFESSSIWFKS